MTEKNLLLYDEKNGIARITLNRPKALNALNADMLEQLSEILETLKQDDKVRGIIITGAGDKSFSAGADIERLNKLSEHEVRELAKLAVDVNNKIETLGKVIIAAINGYALGGGLELAEACMLRVAAKHAKMGHPEVRIGAVAGWGGTTRLPRLIGKGRAAELLLTGKSINAEEAHRIGLVNIVTESDMLLIETERLLNEIISQAPLAVKMTWEAIHRGCNLSLEESALLGADYFGLIAATEDFREGTESFINKAKPLFKGK
jgi:enoyl-CoA hydratase